VWNSLIAWARRVVHLSSQYLIIRMAENFDFELTSFTVEFFVGGIIADDVTLIDV
jgi:hypothetical protein